MKSFFVAMISLFLVSPTFAWKALAERTTTGTIKMEVDVNQASVSQMDILFVVDNSGSMDQYQQNLGKNIDALIGGLVKFDVNAAVVTTDVESGKSGQFVNKVLNSKETGFLDQLRKDILQGVNGSPDEQLFAPTIAALTPPLSLNENKGFLRTNANLVVVYLTDAEDQGTMEALEFVTNLKAIKAGTTGTISAVAIYSPSAGSCQFDSGPAIKFEKALTELNAKTVAICDSQLNKSLTDVGNLLTGNMVSEMERKIKLPMVPALNTMKVIYGPTELQMGDFYQGWMYDHKTMMLMVGEEFDFTTQPVGTKLSIEYTPKDWIK